MFYSETLLSKTGPLARVWLSANLERKLSKTHILQSNIESSISAIVDQGQAPMALRLSGQLLLGVVRIYSRKARYLLDDCNEALMKLKMAFRPGNVDLPTNHAHTSNPAALTLPDVLTELDLLPPIPDASLLLDQPAFSSAELGLNQGRIGRNGDITLLDQDTQLLADDIEQGLAAPEEPHGLEEDELELDLGFGDEPVGGDGAIETSIHVGREAPPPGPLEAEFSDDMKMFDADEPTRDQTADIEFRNGTATPPPFEPGADILPPVDGDTMDIDIDRVGSPVFDNVNGDQLAPTTQISHRFERDSESPLSDIRPSEERELERDYQRNLDSTFAEPEPEEESVHQVPQKRKNRKALLPDAETILPSSLMKKLQQDRSSILKPMSFLPRDPLLLTLMEMQQTGGFVSSIFGENRGKGWAPELRGILSLEVIRKSGKLKRKLNRRADPEDEVEEDERSVQSDKRPRLDIDDEVDEPIATNQDSIAPNNTTLATDGEVIIDIPADDGIQPLMDDEPVMMEVRTSPDEEGAVTSPVMQDVFEDTVAPLVHPADSGPVALGTKHAVHMLRDWFGPSAAEDSSQRAKASVLFQELLSERDTSKVDATKMFFEVLVLATKDAIKVEQEENDLGGPIRVRGKRGLWGAWAEEKAGGEIATQSSREGSIVAENVP
ncbi:MAG: sister chromatid cohesion protein 1 [Peltula sp. TS41687]|nr:MAG: sister chromatid cohesion protein 1 [Peltula sp. TS41687]